MLGMSTSNISLVHIFSKKMASAMVAVYYGMPVERSRKICAAFCS